MYYRGNASKSCSKFLSFTEKPPEETKPKKAAKPKKKSTDDSEDDKPKKATKKRPAKNFSDSDFSEDDFLPKKAAGVKKVGENRTFSDFSAPVRDERNNSPELFGFSPIRVVFLHVNI